MYRTHWWTLGVAIAVAGCAQNSTQGSSFRPPLGSPEGALQSSLAQRLSSHRLSSKIQHVVIIFQENRTTNNLFNGLEGADTVRVAINSRGQTVHLQPQKLTAPYDISHSHSSFETEYNVGFDMASSHCRKSAKCPPPDLRAYAYVPKAEVAPYFAMARQYAFGNHMFQTNQGPSFPAHQYIVSGTSTISDGSPLRAAENPKSPKKNATGGCDSPKGSYVTLIDMQGNENQQAYPCFDRDSLMGLVDQVPSLSWRYYEPHLGPGLWEAPDAVLPIFNSPGFAKNVVAPSSQVLTDIDEGNLANVVWVIPTGAESDHALSTDGSGPSWVASVVNAIGQSKYWDNTAIFVTWDDWGGWYDPMTPKQLNSYELGFRVPLIVISAYAKQHYISQQQHEFGSLLKFTEETFGLPSLNTTDVRSDDLADCFNFSQKPRKFKTIPAPLHAGYFLRQPVSNQEPDDDF